jgi:hypothetical protein
MPLWKVKVTFVGYVEAKDFNEAREFTNDVQEEIPSVFIEKTHTKAELDPSWCEGHLVYHKGTTDRTIREVLDEQKA